jgi:hypothetical protein
LQINYAPAFYLAMLALGLTALALVFLMSTGEVKPILPAQSADGERDMSMLLFAGAAVLLCMGYYMWRAFDRLRNRGPVIEVRPEGIMLRIRENRRYPWSDVTQVALGRHRLRQRLEITVSPERFAELRLPTLFVDDNFAAIRNKPFTIGITGQGLDRPLMDALEEIKRHRPNLVAQR